MNLIEPTDRKYIPLLRGKLKKKMNQNIEGKYFLTTPLNSLKIVKQQKNLKRGSLKKEKNESFINDPDLSA